MKIQNETMADYPLVEEMVADDYYPDHLVEKIRGLLVALCVEIETREPSTEDELLELTHAMTEAINALNEEFWAADSDLETVAREDIARTVMAILDAYGWADVDIEDAIAPRDW